MVGGLCWNSTRVLPSHWRDCHWYKTKAGMVRGWYHFYGTIGVSITFVGSLHVTPLQVGLLVVGGRGVVCIFPICSVS